MAMIDEALKKHNASYKMWLIKAQLLEQNNQVERARETYEEAIKHEVVKSQNQVWICYAEFEINQEAFTRARTILQKARVRMPNDHEIWMASIRLEIRTENIKIS